MSKQNKIFMPEDHMDSLYNSKNPLVRFVHNNRLDRLAFSLPKKNNLKVLDAGCGEGHLIQKLNSVNNKNKYYGADLTGIALKKAKKRCPYANLKKMDLTKLNYDASFFDIVICSEVIEHIYEYEKVISELVRVLKKGGFLIITFPNEKLWTLSRVLLLRRPIKVPDHVNSFQPKYFKEKVNMKLVYQFNLPFNMPFFFSLGCLMKFSKE